MAETRTQEKELTSLYHLFESLEDETEEGEGDISFFESPDNALARKVLENYSERSGIPLNLSDFKEEEQWDMKSPKSTFKYSLYKLASDTSIIRDVLREYMPNLEIRLDITRYPGSPIRVDIVLMNWGNHVMAHMAEYRIGKNGEINLTKYRNKNIEES